MNKFILKFLKGKKTSFEGNRIIYYGRDGNKYAAWNFGNDWYYELYDSPRSGSSNIIPKNYITPDGIRFYYDSGNPIRNGDLIQIIKGGNLLSLNQNSVIKRAQSPHRTRIITENDISSKRTPEGKDLIFIPTLNHYGEYFDNDYFVRNGNLGIINKYNWNYRNRNKNTIEVDGNTATIMNNGKWYRNKPYSTDEVPITVNNPTKKINTSTALSLVRVKPKIKVRSNTNNESLINGKVKKGFTLPEGITNVRETLKMLIENGYSPEKYGARKGIDGIWGEGTQAAWDAYLKNLKPTYTSVSNSAYIPASITSIPSSLNTNISKVKIPNHFDRSQTREYMRLNNISPYSYSGTTRRAVRLVLNGEAGDNEKAIVKLHPELKELLSTYLKKGGIIYKFNNKLSVK